MTIIRADVLSLNTKDNLLVLWEHFEQFYGWLKDTVAPVPCCRVISKRSLLEAMKSKVRRVVLAYGEAKACQGLWFPVVSSRGRHKWLQPLWLLLWRNLKVGLHMLRVNTGPSALSLTHNWAELTQKHFTTLYSEIDGSLRETRGGYMAITQLQWPVALSRAVLVAAIAHNSTCQRRGRPCFIGITYQWRAQHTRVRWKALLHHSVSSDV